MPFDYYQRLSKRDRKIYDASDAVARIDLGDPEKARAARRAVEAALAAEDKRATGRAAQALANAICDDREVPRVVVRILAKRPKDDAAELHGLYVRDDISGRASGATNEPAVIRVWMRTAERKQVVKPKTFLRTLLHEVIHHLDYELLKLADSFHTQGFYRREASLFRQLADADPAALPVTRAEAAPPSPPRRAVRPAEQLSLFGEPTKIGR